GRGARGGQGGGGGVAGGMRGCADVLAGAGGVTWDGGKDGLMKGPVTASGRDLRTLAGIVSDDRGEPPAEGVAPSLLTDLLGLVGGDLVVFGGSDSSRQLDWFGQTMPTEAHHPEFDEASFWKHYWNTPCSYPEHTGDLR